MWRSRGVLHGQVTDGRVDGGCERQRAQDRAQAEWPVCPPTRGGRDRRSSVQDALIFQDPGDKVPPTGGSLPPLGDQIKVSARLVLPRPRGRLCRACPSSWGFAGILVFPGQTLRSGSVPVSPWESSLSRWPCSCRDTSHAGTWPAPPQHGLISADYICNATLSNKATRQGSEVALWGAQASPEQGLAHLRRDLQSRAALQAPTFWLVRETACGR